MLAELPIALERQVTSSLSVRVLRGILDMELELQVSLMDDGIGRTASRCWHDVN